MNIRSKTIAITPSLDKWIRWVAIRDNTTPEAMVNDCITARILTRFPDIKQIQDDHDVASAKLWNEAADKLKEGK